MAAVNCHRRLLLAVTLSGLLAIAALEGAFHAALHLHHAAHGADLALSHSI